MGKILVFLTGIFVGVIVLALGVLFFVHRSGENGAPQPVKLSVPQGAGVGRSAENTNPVFSTTDKMSVETFVKVEFVPQLEASMKGAKQVAARVVLREASGTDVGGIVGARVFDSPKFPLEATIPWQTSYLIGKAGKKAPNLLALAMVCLDVAADACEPNAAAYIGYIRQDTDLTFQSNAALRVNVNPILVNRRVQPMNFAECTRSDSRASGSVVPTEAFLKNPAHPEKLMLVAVPFPAFRTNAAFQGAGKTPVTAKMVEEAVKEGELLVAPLQVRKSEPIPFSVRHGKGKEFWRFQFLAVGCQPKESDMDCAARAFPPPPQPVMEIPERRWYKLAPKDFLLPVCGEKGRVLYLHEWNPSLPRPSAAEVGKAPIPEITDGMVF